MIMLQCPLGKVTFLGLQGIDEQVSLKGGGVCHDSASYGCEPELRGSVARSGEEALPKSRGAWKKTKQVLLGTPLL